MEKINSFKERIFNNIKERKILICIFVVIWVLSIILSCNYYKNTLGKESYGSEQINTVIELNNNTKIDQILPVEGSTSTVSLKFGTYLRKNSGNVYIAITGEDSNYQYFDKTIKVTSIEDNAFATYKLNKELNSKNDKSIRIIISSDSEEGKGVGLYFSSLPFFNNSTLKINNEVSELELGVKYLYENDNLYQFSQIAIIGSIVLLSALLLIIIVINPKIEIIFSSFVLVFGLLLMLVISPGAAPDELLHYEGVLQISNKVLLEDENTIDAEYLNFDSYANHINTPNSYNRFIRDFNKPLKLKGKKIEFEHKLADGYIGYYIPQTIGVIAARLLKVNSMKTLYAGRFLNLLFYVVCVYFAIKNAPIKKMLLGVISIIPIFVQQAASLSYDASINGLVLLSISFLLKWLCVDEKINKKDYIFALIISAFLAPAKVVYGVLVLLYWLVPTSRFKDKKQKILLTLLLCSPTIILLIYNIYIRTIGMFNNTIVIDESMNMISINFDDIQINELANKKLFNVLYIVEHPIETIAICYRTIRFYLSTWFYQSLGRSMAGSNLTIPMTIIRAILVCLCVTSLRDEKHSISNLTKVCFVLSCIVIAMFVLVSMLTGWTYRDDEMIRGVQGRYFCPLLPYFFSIFSNNKIKTPKKLDIYVIFAMLIVSLEVILYILSYTFVN